jgi:hypothetical protein
MPLTESSVNSLAPDEAVEAITNTDDADVMLIDGRAHHASGDGVSVTIRDANRTNRFHRCTLTLFIGKSRGS